MVRESVAPTVKREARTLTPAQELKLLAGLAVQPFLAAAVAFVSFPLVLIDRTGRTLAGGFTSDPTDAAISVALGVGVVALFVTIVGVFPTAVWVVKRHSLTLTQALLFGLGFANLPLVLGIVLTRAGYGPAGVLRGVAFASLIGLTGSAAFWVISLREVRPRS